MVPKTILYCQKIIYEPKQTFMDFCKSKSWNHLFRWLVLCFHHFLINLHVFIFVRLGLISRISFLLISGKLWRKYVLPLYTKQIRSQNTSTCTKKTRNSIQPSHYFHKKEPKIQKSWGKVYMFRTSIYIFFFQNTYLGASNKQSTNGIRGSKVLRILQKSRKLFTNDIFSIIKFVFWAKLITWILIKCKIYIFWEYFTLRENYNTAPKNHLFLFH